MNPTVTQAYKQHVQFDMQSPVLIERVQKEDLERFISYVASPAEMRQKDIA